MSVSCHEFRNQLSAWLRASAEGGSEDRGAAQGQALHWNDHLLSCGACRRLLEDERALNELLGALPDPRWTRRQRVRLLARLQSDARLESLLDLADLATEAPTGLVERVWAHVQSEERVEVEAEFADSVPAALDQHLAQIESIEAPAGLAQRVWAHCRAEGEARTPELVPPQKPTAIRGPGHPSKRRPVLRGWIKTGLAAAGLAAWLWYLPGQQTPGSDLPGDENVHVAQESQNPGAEAPSGPNSGTPSGSQDSNLAGEPDRLDASDEELLAMLDTLEILDMVEELDGEEWELLDEYDRLALLALEDEWWLGEDSGGAAGGDTR